MIFEFVNPSDPYTFISPDLEVAAFVTVLLGNGKGAANQLDGNLHVPMFLFGGLDKFILDNFSKPLDEWIEHMKRERYIDIADSLDSVVIGDISDRNIFDAALSAIDDPYKKEAFRVKWHDEKLSSINDFGTFAWETAKAIRQQKEEVDVQSDGEDRP